MSETITRQDADATVVSDAPVDVRWAPTEPARKPRRLWLKIGVPAAAVVAAATVCSLVLIAPGTTAAGVPVGGQTSGAAAESISSRLADIEVTLGEGGPTVSAADLGATVDASALADAAFAGSPMWNVTAWFAEYGTPDVSLDADRAANALRAALPDAYTDPTPAAVTFQDGAYAVTPAVDGTGVSLDAVRGALQSALSTGAGTATVDPTPEAVASVVTTAAAETSASSLNDMIAEAGFYVGDDRAVPVTADTLASWVDVAADETGTFSFTVDAAAIQTAVDTLPDQVNQDPVDANVLSNEAGTVLATLVEGQDGRALGDTSNVARDFADQLAAGDASYDLAADVTARSTVSTVRLAEVDLGEQRLYLKENGKVVDTWLISSGRDGAVTYQGHYSIGWRTPLQDMKGTSRDTGSKYTQPDVPWVMYFNGNQAFHGAYWHDNFGNQMSAGCVNMPPALAKKLYDWMPDGGDVWIHA
ncbi:Putative peptidoglycan binding domain-containing protein [Microbacterium sp. LKL04]|uniref:L,D-transpeptidase family protein n=1 Tax=Microbacterium sp. LKL04 TaxID=912630 RepID=UPI000875B45E|nr:L,D-transpeptidase family protein [Microbacterium sp. LKL04]SCY43989.1 Putative peptidoglycan binding domain-containing protein [Microbacterium sp. LKL04]